MPKTKASATEETHSYQETQSKGLTLSIRWGTLVTSILIIFLLFAVTSNYMDLRKESEDFKQDWN